MANHHCLFLGSRKYAGPRRRKRGDFVLYRMGGDDVHEVRAAHVVGWVRTTLRLGGAHSAPVTELDAIVEFMEPVDQQRRSQVLYSSASVFRYLTPPGMRGRRYRQGEYRRWISVLPRASLWQRLPFVALDERRERFMLPAYFESVISGYAGVEKLEWVDERSPA